MSTEEINRLIHRRTRFQKMLDVLNKEIKGKRLCGFTFHKGREIGYLEGKLSEIITQLETLPLTQLNALNLI